MGFFERAGVLLDQLIEWLGIRFKAFLEDLVSEIDRIWERIIRSALILAYGVGVVLYAIFYAGKEIGETLMEVWDPRYHEKKDSQVFSIRQAPQSGQELKFGQAPQGSPLPTNRSEAKILTLRNW
ncbi:hypothetical protein BMF77_01925 [Dolichospermum sp. UHCC 0315A]|jgi:hypothetical protein|uniref:hypothetical protein n=1 Tax=Dolichospermum sp. UHCC 0315A TaxID=1914871 RepID=UPI0011E81855|nr:hypothetical protein [Dolichospermum sp. UHCC 0315A]QEI41340.1 hypothetical protein BMF77_01925 [Dolichospermum sp. UHCC 0315A]